MAYSLETSSLDWEWIKRWLILSIDRWRVQENKREVTTDDVIEFLHREGFLCGEAWDSFVGRIPDKWKEMY